jgi:hypothetical protein
MEILVGLIVVSGIYFGTAYVLGDAVDMFDF